MLVPAAGHGPIGASRDQMAVSSSANHTPMGSPMQPPLEPRQALLQALGQDDWLVGDDAATLADTLLACVKDGHLTLTPTAQDVQDQLPLAQLADRLADLPVAAWRALADHAASTGRPLTGASLQAPAAAQDLGAVVMGLNALTDLSELRISPSGTSDALDLHLLAHAPAQLTVHLVCTRAGAWDLTLPPAMACVLDDDRQHYFRNPGPATLRYHDLDGHEAQPPRKLDEFLYDRNAKEFGDRDMKAQQRQKLASAIQLNGKGHFDAKSAAQVGLSDNAIVCRHLVAHHLDQESGRTVGPASLLDFRSVDAIEQAVSARTELRIREVMSRPASHVFSSASFGQALNAELRSMRAGEERRFLMTTPLHAMAVTLRKKDRPGSAATTAFAVRLYDPNRTATRARVTFASPERVLAPRWQRMDGWLGSLSDTYFASPQQTACLYRWDKSGSAAPQLHGFSAAQRSDPEFMRTLMTSGGHGHLPDAVKLAASAAGQDKTALMKFLSARGESGSTSLSVALRQGYADSVTAFVHVVAHTAAPLTEQDRFALLRGAFRELDGPLPAFAALIVSLQPKTAAAYAKAVLDVPPGLITDEHRMALLEARTDAAHAPLIHVLCSRAPSASDSDLAPEYNGLRLIVQSIASAQTLNIKQKCSLIAAPVRTGLLSTQTAAQVAMKLHGPSAPAVLISAVLNSQATAAHKDLMIKAMKVTPEELMKAFEKSPAHVRAQTALAETMLKLAVERDRRDRKVG